jgi:hypothetical protein
VVPVQEVPELRHERLVDGVRRGHEVRPVEEAAGERHAVLEHDVELFVDDGAVVAAPHQRATGAGPEVGADPDLRSAVEHHRCRVSLHREESPVCRGVRPSLSGAAPNHTLTRSGQRIESIRFDPIRSCHNERVERVNGSVRTRQW